MSTENSGCCPVPAARRVDRLAVGRQHDAVGGGIPARRDLARLAGGQVQRHQREAVGFEARALHRAVVQRLAVGAEHRAGVPRRVGRGEVLRRAAAVGVDLVQVEVGRPRLFAIGLARTEHQLPAVRRPRDIRWRRRTGLDGTSPMHVGADQRGVLQHRLAVAEIGDEHAVEAAIVPRIPVADEEAVEDHAACSSRLPCSSMRFGLHARSCLQSAKASTLNATRLPSGESL